MPARNIKILGIETSCDDTGVAVLEVKNGSFNVLSNIIASQIEIHKKYGGVFPAMAKREHQANLIPTLIESLEKSGLLVLKEKEKQEKFKKLEKILDREPELYKQLIPFLQKHKKPKVDYISITNGPGLEPCLWVGVNLARALSYFWNIPLLPINHIESHILINFLENPKIKFPAIALVVSGGHTQIILVKKIGSYKILGETRDDAAGECFDKCAKLLGLEYPGGPVISKLAEKADRAPTSADFIKLPRPMIGTKDYDFSFSGLKTAVLYADQKVKNKDENYKKQMAAEVQQAIIDVLVKKTMKAVKDFKAKSLILGGGVSANKELRLQFQSAVNRHCEESQRRSNLNLIFPPANLSTDNALMTAITGYFHRKNPCLPAGRAWQKLKANANLRISK